MSLLSPSTRNEFSTLLDAVSLRDVVTLRQANDVRDAIIYLETDREPVTISRLKFKQTIQAYATAMQQLGIGRRDLVVIAHTQNLESIYAFWGAMLVGAIPSMFPTLTEKLDPGIYMQSMAELVRLSDVRVVLTTDEFAPSLDSRLGCPVFGSRQLLASISENNPGNLRPHNPDPFDIAFLQHSSGTTGLQKGVALSHQAVLNQLANYGQAIELDERDVIVSWLPLYHDMGLIAGFILPLVQGIPLVLMSPFDWVRHPALLFRAIDAYHGTLCWLPNFAYNHCARRIRMRDTEGLSAASMRLFINCSEPVYHESHRLFLERFSGQGVKPEMLSVSFAMAENTFGVTQTQAGEEARLDIVDRQLLENDLHARPVKETHPRAQIRLSCGPPIAGTEVRVVDDSGRSFAERRVGEVAVKSDCMLSEYYKRPDLKPFHEGWFLTGDKGYLADGQLYIVGRSKDLIINAGKNIYPQDIEAIVNEVPGVRPGRAVAFGIMDEREGTELVAVVAETITEDPEKRREIAAQIRRDVVKHSMVTINYVQVVGAKWLIKTSSGKIARGANRDKWLRERA
jgi:acyl-CoA synthetase (AMP-forming)/AMP-acid ligase II